ncbi:MAG: hypothetical protein RRA32_02260 [bacterium]|nr:hypothetical protein [bacterium]MDT8395256.1 hypothetical protein [bacterium]
MVRILVLCLCMLLSPVSMAMAGEKGVDEQAAVREPKLDREAEAKEMSGMSIVGNEEAPKSLYIVPWKSSEIGVQTSLDTMFSEGDVPVDREVFKRQIEFYQISTNK